jgi:hypothetical protein
MENSLKQKLYKLFCVSPLFGFPLLFAAFVGLYKYDQWRYVTILREDGLVEYTTVGLLVVAAILSLVITAKIRKDRKYYHWFFIAFFAFCLLGALEEMSWGQRVVGVDSPEFFVEHSDQLEVNVHNVFQKWTGLKTKHIAAIVLLLYGACLPVLVSFNPRARRFFERVRFVVPSPTLSVGFLLGTILMLDKPTGWEEEIGEFFYSLCFVLFMMMQIGQLNQRITGAGSHGG